jgi:hypothetical protein
MCLCIVSTETFESACRLNVIQGFFLLGHCRRMVIARGVASFGT